MSFWSRLFGTARTATEGVDLDILRTVRHPRYNPRSCYIELTGAEIATLPIAAIGDDELHELRGEFSWVGVDGYCDRIEPLPGELGYDALAGRRYVQARPS